MASSRIEERVAVAIANAIRLRREELGLSQEELSLNAGVSRTTVQDLEVGRSDHKVPSNPANPRLMTLLRLADALDLSVEGILGDAQRVYKSRSPEEMYRY